VAPGDPTVSFFDWPLPPRSSVRPGRRCRPQVEALEPRLTPSFTPQAPVPVGMSPSSVAMGDFNGDGRQDLAGANLGSTSASIRLGDGAGGFSSAPDVAVGSGPVSVDVGDFNGDGKPDLAVANGSDTKVSIRLGNGAGGFTAAPDVAVDEGPL